MGLALLFSTFAIAQDAADFDSLVQAGSAARDQNDATTALKLYTGALELKPDWPDGWWYVGVLEYGNGSYSAAQDALSHFIQLTSDAGPALALRGLCEFELGAYPQSLQDIQHGLALGAANKPRNEAVLRYHEALLLTLGGEFEDALRQYAFFSHTGATDPEMLTGVGLAGLRVQLLPKDVEPARRELLLAAGSAAFHFMAGDNDAAQREFQALFERFPAAVNAHYFYGYLLFAKDPELAVVEFKRELEVAPANADAHVMLAWYFLLQNNSVEALPHAQKAVAEAPASTTSQLALGRALVETGDVTAGTERLEKVVKLDPGNTEIHLALVKAYSKSGRKEDAQRERLLCLETTKDGAITVAHP